MNINSPEMWFDFIPITLFTHIEIQNQPWYFESFNLNHEILGSLFVIIPLCVNIVKNLIRVFSLSMSETLQTEAFLNFTGQNQSDIIWCNSNLSCIILSQKGVMEYQTLYVPTSQCLKSLKGTKTAINLKTKSLCFNNFIFKLFFLLLYEWLIYIKDLKLIRFTIILSYIVF